MGDERLKRVMNRRPVIQWMPGTPGLPMASFREAVQKRHTDHAGQKSTLQPP
jgi:hypothetical protein